VAKVAEDEIKISEEIRNQIPPLQEWELKLLEESVCRDECREPLVVWRETGILLDGHHRLDICRRNGKKFKTVELSFASEAEALAWVIDNQIGRRNLSETQRAMCAAARANLAHGQKEADVPIGTSAEEAADKFRVSRRSVFRAKKVLDEGVDELKAACRADQIPVSVAAEIAELDPKVQRKLAADPPEASRVAKEKKKAKATKRKKERAKKKAEAVEENHPLSGERFKLHVGDFEAVAKREIEDSSIDAIITDPPYPEEFLPEYKKLARVALRVLRPGGHLLAMAGQANFHEVMKALCYTDGLGYQWVLSYLTPGQSTQCFGRKVKSNWKPIVWLVKGKNDWEHVEDTVRSDQNDKRFHEWGQSVGGIAQLVARFTVAKSLVFDPFVGGGSTAVAAVMMDRLFVGCDVDAGCVSETAKRLGEIQ
jgi:site-specific DNA-methyltransferase (adenine-specific)